MCFAPRRRGADAATWRSVLWRDGGDEWRVFADRCPHRQAPLSEGRVNEQGELECPYHGRVAARRAAARAAS